MAALSKDDILEAIANMTVLEVSELVSAMEEKFGVTAAAPVAVAAAGAAVGLVLNLPVDIEALLLGGLGGMVIMNTTVMELPSENEGRFGMFVLGGVLYAALLIAI